MKKNQSYNLLLMLLFVLCHLPLCIVISLSQKVNRLGRNEGIQIINVVRKDAQVNLLKAQGAEIVLNSSLKSIVLFSGLFTS